MCCGSAHCQPELSQGSPSTARATEASLSLKHAVRACSNDNAGSNDDTVAALAILSNPQLSGNSVYFPLVSSLPSNNQPSSVASYYRTNAAVSCCSNLSGAHPGCVQPAQRGKPQPSYLSF